MSEFAEALRKSGYDFSEIAERQQRIFLSSRRKAAGAIAAGLLMIGATSYDCADKMNQRDFPLTLAWDVTLVAISFNYGRNKLQESRLAYLDRKNSLALATLAAAPLDQEPPPENT